MRVLAEMGLLLVLGLVVGLRSDGVFIAGLLLAVSVAGLVEWLRPAQWSWVLCTAYLVIAVAVPSWCAFMPLIAYDTARLPALASTGARAGARTAASGRSPSVSRTAASRRSLADAMRSAPWLSAAARWIWVLPLIALWFARGTDRLQTLVMTLVALLGFVLGRARASSDEARRALLHAQDRARESSRATRSRIARHRMEGNAPSGPQDSALRDWPTRATHAYRPGGPRQCGPSADPRDHAGAGRQNGGQGDERYGRCARVRHVGCDVG